MELIFQEEKFLVKSIAAPEEIDAAMRLRHEVFREELRWVPPTPDRSDRDRYDDFAHPIGVFDEQGELIGHVRLILAPDPYMIEKEFSVLLPADGSFKKTPGMAESTRICVRKDCRKISVGPATLAHLLYKAVYQWSLMNDSRYLVTIIEQRYFHYLKRYFPFREVADFAPLGEGVMSGIALLDWREFEERAREKRPSFFNWISDLRPLVPSGSPLRALY
jgi:N-acyl-L-homoserine lactone synthetase